ncbi:hypothetical protein MP228_006547 [Amoeboaphelidium protococcarum]|nr:hypothetical protein MP228_006547 [Amoeboaphelidium protococcarum]
MSEKKKPSSVSLLDILLGSSSRKDSGQSLVAQTPQDQVSQGDDDGEYGDSNVDNASSTGARYDGSTTMSGDGLSSSDRINASERVGDMSFTGRTLQELIQSSQQQSSDNLPFEFNPQLSDGNAGGIQSFAIDLDDNAVVKTYQPQNQETITMLKHAVKFSNKQLVSHNKDFIAYESKGGVRVIHLSDGLFWRVGGDQSTVVDFCLYDRMLVATDSRGQLSLYRVQPVDGEDQVKDMCQLLVKLRCNENIICARLLSPYQRLLLILTSEQLYIVDTNSLKALYNNPKKQLVSLDEVSDVFKLKFISIDHMAVSECDANGQFSVAILNQHQSHRLLQFQVDDLKSFQLIDLNVHVDSFAWLSPSSFVTSTNKDGVMSVFNLESYSVNANKVDQKMVQRFKFDGMGGNEFIKLSFDQKCSTLAASFSAHNKYLIFLWDRDQSQLSLDCQTFGESDVIDLYAYSSEGVGLVVSILSGKSVRLIEHQYAVQRVSSPHFQYGQLSKAGNVQQKQHKVQSAAQDNTGSRQSPASKAPGILSVADIEKQYAMNQQSTNRSSPTSMAPGNSIMKQLGLLKDNPPSPASNGPVASSMNVDHQSMVQLIKKEMETFKEQISKDIQKQLNQGAPMKAAVSIDQEAISAELSKIVQNQLKDIVKVEFRDTILPSFQTALQGVMKQLDRAVADGMAEMTKQVKQQTEKMQKTEYELLKRVEQTQQLQKQQIDTLQKMVLDLGNAVHELKTSSRHQLEQQQQQMQQQQQQQMGQNGRQVSGLLMSKSIDDLIKQDIEHRDYETAFVRALESKNFDTLLKLVTKLDIDQIFEDEQPLISQPVLLSFVQYASIYVSQNLKDVQGVEMLVLWVQEALVSLNPDDALIKEYVSAIMPSVCQMLEGACQVMSKMSPVHPSLRNLKVIVRIANGFIK